MAEAMVAKLTHAADVMMAGPNEVSSEQRHAAEEVLLDFQNMKSPFMLCRHLFDTCQNDYVLFQTVTLLKNALIREWSFLSSEEVTALITYMFNYVTVRTNLKSYVREQISMVLAIMEKRSSATNGSSERENILNKVSMIIGSGDPNLQTIGCSILTGLLNEYSSSFKSSNLGLNWETHIRAKKKFEANDMRKIFQYCVEGLCQLEKAPVLTSELIQLTQKMLSICSKILMWNFQHVPISMPRRILGLMESIQVPVLRPSLSWSDVLVKSDIIHMFFKIQWKVRDNQELSHLALQCLVQLASLNGPVFKSNDLEASYVSMYMQNFLQYLTSCDILDHEALGISSIFWKLTSENSKFIFSPSESFKVIREPFFKKMTELTCYFACKAATEEVMSMDDQIFMEAYEQMLQGWSMTFLISENLSQPICEENIIQMFNCYLKCHLSVPDGNRRQDMYEDCEEIDEIEENDRSRYKLQLSIIGCFGRKILSHTLPLLFKLIEERVCRLYGQLQRMVQQSSGMNVGDNTMMNMLCEDLHWLVMISGHILMMESKGETAMIPTEINTYSYKQVRAGVDVKATLHVLGSPDQNISELLGHEQTSTDHAVRLIAAVFRLCEVEKRALQAKLASLLSPEVGTTVMWFLENFVLSYLLPVEEFYAQISPALNESFGKDSEAGVWTVNFILRKIYSNLLLWNSEAELMDQTIACFFSLVRSKARSSAVLKNHEVWELMRREASHELIKLQPKAKRLLYRSLNLMGVYSRDDNTFFTELFKPLHDQFQAVTCRQDFNIAYNNEGVKTFIMHFIEALIGITESFPIKLDNPMWEFCIPVISTMNKLMEIYHNNPRIVKLILDFYLCVADIVSFAKPEVKTAVSDKYLEMLQIFSKHNTGLQTVEVNADDEQYEHLMIILKILTSLTTCELINLFPNSVPQQDQTQSNCGPDLALFGLHIFVSLRIDELLKFPSFCSAYYKLIVLVAHLFPAKIVNLPADNLGMILHTLEVGLTSLSSAMALHCFEVLADVAGELFKMELQTPQRNILQPFLKVVMNLVFFRQMETDHCVSTSSALFTLICCYELDYRKFVKEIIEQQKEDHHRDQLIQSFNALTADVELCVSRANKCKFRNNFDKHIDKIQGVLCVK